MAYAAPAESRCQQDRHKAPTSAPPFPCPYRTRALHLPFLVVKNPQGLTDLGCENSSSRSLDTSGYLPPRQGAYNAHL